MPEEITFDERNIPVGLDMVLIFTVGTEKFEIYADPDSRVLNPYEHDKPESYLGDVRIMVEEMWENVRQLFSDDETKESVALRLATAGAMAAENA